jgi:hypothetical protein
MSRLWTYFRDERPVRGGLAGGRLPKWRCRLAATLTVATIAGAQYFLIKARKILCR